MGILQTKSDKTISQIREAHVRENLEREMTMAENLAHEVWVLWHSIALLPDGEVSTAELKKLQNLHESVVAQSNLSSASSSAKDFLEALKSHLTKLTLTKNEKLKSRKGKANVAKLLRRLSKPGGKQVVDFLSHRVHRAIIQDPDSELATTPVISVNDLTDRVFASIAADSSRSPTLDILEILELFGFVRIVKGFDELITAYREDARNGNPVASHIQTFSPTELQQHNRFPVRKAHSSEYEYQTIKRTTKLVMLTSDFFDFIHLRGATTSRWNCMHSDVAPKVRDNFLEATKRYFCTGGLVAFAVFGGTLAGSEPAVAQMSEINSAFSSAKNFGTAELPVLTKWGISNAVEVVNATDIGNVLINRQYVSAADQHTGNWAFFFTDAKFANYKVLNPGLWKLLIDQPTHIDYATAADQYTGDGKIIVADFMGVNIDHSPDEFAKPTHIDYATAADQYTGDGKIIVADFMGVNIDHSPDEFAKPTHIDYATAADQYTGDGKIIVADFMGANPALWQPMQ